MKTKFATFDLCAVLHDLRKLQGMRVVNVYDINSKTYLLKMQKPNEKAFILFESGIRIHITTYDWPKATIPSGFSMKFRKHINTKRLTAVSQVGIDRIIDLQFGDAERSCHVIVELYDRGNVVLTDHDYMILNILRPRTDHDKDVRFSVKERYPLEQARQPDDFLPSPQNILLFLQNAKTGDPLKRCLIRHVPFGALLMDHAFTKFGIPSGAQIGVHIPANEAGAELIGSALEEAKRVSDDIISYPHGGFIAYEELQKPAITPDGMPTTILSFQEYFPYDFVQFRDENSKFSILEFPSFSDAVDKYYSSIEMQKAEQREITVEKESDKKLQNIKKDHEKRIQALTEVKEIQERRGEYVLYNKDFVEQALLVIRTALTNLKAINKELSTRHRGPKQPPKTELGTWLESLANLGEQPAAKAIIKLKLDKNRFTLRLSNPYDDTEEPMNIELDIGLNADQNARRLFDDKRAADVKKQKTAAATKTALKSAMKSAKQQANNKIMQARMHKTNVIRARKSYWFEKFLWFVSSDGFLVLAGRDAQQNELLVKRYMRPGDIYVHAEIQGAASVVIRNRCALPLEELPPPRTLNEAGAMAICFSTAWEANVSITSWWVRHDQVSRTAPTGEFLVAGSFMIRGKRNFLSSFPLQLGFGLMFRMDDESIARHKQLRSNSLDSRTRTQSSTTSDEFKEEVQRTDDDDDETLGEPSEHGDEKVKEDGTENEEEADEDEFPDVQVDVTGIGSKQEYDQLAETDLTTEQETECEIDEMVDKEEEEEEVENVMEETPEEEMLLETITAQPLPEDQLLFPLAVCGPYTAMQRFKFKVKITPGTNKRGKAVKMALELFNRDKTLSLAERALLKTLNGDDRLMQLLPNKVRVSAPMLMTTTKKKK